MRVSKPLLILFFVLAYFSQTVNYYYLITLLPYNVVWF